MAESFKVSCSIYNLWLWVSIFVLICSRRKLSDDGCGSLGHCSEGPGLLEREVCHCGADFEVYYTQDTIQCPSDFLLPVASVTVCCYYDNGL